MTAIYLISDTHFGHANILNFKRDDGTPMRPFANVEEMDFHMIERWNATVRPQDHVYHLGDVALKQQDLWKVTALNGHKRLVRGNHDIFKTKQYMQVGFEEVYGVRVINDLILSHIPLHPESVKPQWLNCHGHLHNNQPAKHLGPKYFNVSVEMIDYTPITIEEAKDRHKKLWVDNGI